MNYREARPLKDGSGWHMTVRNDGRIRAVGNCVDCKPHKTKENAEECWKEFGKQSFIDKALPKPHKTEPWGPCDVCKHRTPYEYRDPATHAHMRLCDEHATPEVVREHLVVSTVCWYS